MTLETPMSLYQIAIIGAGKVGRKRAAAVRDDPRSELAAVVDIDPQAARAVSETFGGQVLPDWRAAVSRNGIDIVIVSTFNKDLAPVSLAAIQNGKHVLCEKPLAVSVEQATRLVDEADNRDIILKTGFNHRHHPAVRRARELFDQGAIGRLMLMRGCYGHGGRSGYEKEWRADPELSGGGELLDQGIHMADLFRWFAGGFKEAFGYTTTAGWDMPVEDNGFALFRNSNVVASLHTSWTQWKNAFSIEIFGTKGYLIVKGLGGSYGPETLTLGRRASEGRPEEESLSFPEEDPSWQEEWNEFLSAVKDRRPPLGSGRDGLEALRMIEAVYQSSQTKKAVAL